MKTLSRRSLVKLLAPLAVASSLPLHAARAQSQAPTIPAANWAAQKKRLKILQLEMAYVDIGKGIPMVFLHGNPTSSYLWRNIIPHVQTLGRCIAPDLIGLGDSGHFANSGPGSYDYFSNREYVFEFMARMNFDQKVILVMHDWGSTLGIDWAKNNPAKVAGMAYMAPLLRPPTVPMSAAPTEFAYLRTAEGEQAALNDNIFVERMIKDLGDYLSDDDRAEYRRPFLIPGESRRATLTWPRLIPFGGTPEIMDKKWVEVAEWLAATDIPKLFFKREPSVGREATQLEFLRSVPNQTEAAVFGGHYVQEVSPHAVGRALARWVKGLR